MLQRYGCMALSMAGALHTNHNEMCDIKGQKMSFTSISLENNNETLCKMFIISLFKFDRDSDEGMGSG